MGRGRAVFPQKIVQTFPFHLMLNTCSGRSEPSYFPFDALNFLCDNEPLSDIFLHFHHLFQSRVANLEQGNLFFLMVHA
jgi:hypothetical protein